MLLAVRVAAAGSGVSRGSVCCVDREASVHWIPAGFSCQQGGIIHTAGCLQHPPYAVCQGKQSDVTEGKAGEAGAALWLPGQQVPPQALQGRGWSTPVTLLGVSHRHASGNRLLPVLPPSPPAQEAIWTSPP